MDAGLRPLAICRWSTRRATIRGLLLGRRPTAVCWFVIAVVVHALDRVSIRRGFAHVGVKVFEDGPSFTNANAAAAVSLEVFRVAITASGEHARPNTVDPRALLAVDPIQFASELGDKATA
jgi:hypothetical protein